MTIWICIWYLTYVFVVVYKALQTWGYGSRNMGVRPLKIMCMALENNRRASDFMELHELQNDSFEKLNTTLDSLWKSEIE